ncbi:MAG: GNAT family N-acetyltransferase [[Clostridium] leptum]
MFRLSVKQDYPDLCGLWLEAFGEGEESAKFVFEGFSGYQHIYVLEEERAVVCMACAVPCSLQGRKEFTLRGRHKKSHRGKGLMSALLEYAEQEEKRKGAEFSVLIPKRLICSLSTAVLVMKHGFTAMLFR